MTLRGIGVSFRSTTHHSIVQKSQFISLGIPPTHFARRSRFRGQFGRGVTRFGDKWLLWPLWSAHQPTTCCGCQGSCHLPSGMWRIRHPAAACWWSPVHCRAKRTSPCSVEGLACPAVREGPTCAPRLSSMSVPSSPASVLCALSSGWRMPQSWTKQTRH